MNWQSLSGRLGSLPLVLAGPILRRVTPNAVTVWFALLKPAKVSLRVFDSASPGSPLIATGIAPNTEPAATTPIGKNLHIVAVTVRTDTPLVPGKTYCYDATIVTTDATATTQTLAQAMTAPGATAPTIAYDPFDFPSFALPPQDLNLLRIVHGSCRKPHGGTLKATGKAATNPTPDQLATLDALIAADVGDPTKRPHQLLLTGDQIYADDVDDELLVSLTDAAGALLGWSGNGEILPSADPTTHDASALAPGSRVEVITNAGFTGDDRRSHLLSLGEFFAMYLFVWSDVLWSGTITYDEFEPILNVTLSAHPDWKVPDTLKSEYADRQAAVQTFRKTLPDVRRALANIPTYMILDDHEVTDDFNMTRHFCNQVYGDDLGVRVVQNGLTAFAICQAWGNVPEQFDPNTPTAAGTQLLAQLAMVAAAADNAGAFEKASDTIQTLVGVHQIGQMKDTSHDALPNSIHAFHEGAATDTVTVNGVAVNTKSLRYNFTVEGPAHQVLFTDTRTWRGFTGDNSLPTLLYGQLPDQIINATPPLGERLQLLVCSTNAPPIAQIRLLVHAGGAQWLTTLSRRKETPRSAIDFWDIPDSWDFPSRDFDEMIAAVTTRLAQRNGTIVAPLVILSGDVHFSFSSRMGYWATARLGDKTPHQPVNIAIGQLVSSSLKNEANGTRAVELGGYGNADPGKGQWLKLAPYIGATGFGIVAGLTIGGIALFGGKTKDAFRDSVIAAAAGALLGLLVPFILFGRRLSPHISEAYVGWNIPRNGPDKLIAKDTASVSYPFKVTGAAPTYDQNLNGSGLTNALITPDYRYRLDYLIPKQGGETTPVTPPPSLPAAGATSAQWAQSFAAVSNARTDAISKNIKLPDAVGHNAIGEIRFVWPKDGDALTRTGKAVQHRLHWQTPGPTGVAMWDEYDIPLDNTINDTTYQDLTAEIAP